MPAHHTTVTFWGVEQLNPVRIYKLTKSVAMECPESVPSSFDPLKGHYEAHYNMIAGSFGFALKKQNIVTVSLSAKNSFPQKIFTRSGSGILQLALLMLIDDEVEPDLRSTVDTTLPDDFLEDAYQVALRVSPSLDRPQWVPVPASRQGDLCISRIDRDHVPGSMDFRA